MGSRIATARDLPEELSLGRTLLWRDDLPPGKSSPVIAGSRLFLTAWEGDRRLVICLDRATGKRLWEAHVVKHNVDLAPFRIAEQPVQLGPGFLRAADAMVHVS